MRHYLRLVDTNTAGRRNDVTPVFADAEALSEMVRDLVAPFASTSFDAVAGIDALGFVLGGAMAFHAHKGFLAIRKGGKLPSENHSISFRDYSGDDKSLSVRAGSILQDLRVVLVDDWVETGAQVSAAVQLIEREGGRIVGIAALNIDSNPVTRVLCSRYKCHSLWPVGEANGA